MKNVKNKCYIIMHFVQSAQLGVRSVVGIEEIFLAK